MVACGYGWMALGLLHAVVVVMRYDILSSSYREVCDYGGGVIGRGGGRAPPARHSSSSGGAVMRMHVVWTGGTCLPPTSYVINILPGVLTRGCCCPSVMACGC